MIVSNTLNVKEILKIYLIEQKIYIPITKMSDTFITVIYHAMSLTVLYVYHSDLSRYFSDCTVRPIVHCRRGGFIKGDYCITLLSFGLRSISIPLTRE